MSDSREQLAALLPVRKDAMSRVSKHDAKRLNAVAAAVLDVQGYVPFSVRYSIAVLALETLDALDTAN